MHTNYRNCSGWIEEKLPLSTTSDEACKLYDAALSQYVGWYDDAALGGIEITLNKLSLADPDFVMGKVVVIGLDLLGTGRSPRFDEGFAKSIEDLVTQSSKQDNLSIREKLHVDAIKLFADGQMKKAAETWEEITLNHPTDMLAIKYAHDAYFYLGQQQHMRNSICKVLPSWKSTTPLYGYLYGMLAFSEVENNLHDKAMKSAQHGLMLNRKDAWSTHAAAHVLEMNGDQKEGIKFLSTTLDDWTFCGMLACHNFWHWALYHIEKGEYQAALDIYDTEIRKRAHSGALLDIVDMTSLLYRLNLEGVNVGKRWEEAFEICLPHLNDHITVFNDVHMLFSCLGANQCEITSKYISSFTEIANGDGDQGKIAKEVGLPLFDAVIAYNNGDYDKTVDLLYEIRYKIIDIGGSNAQRDVLNLLLIASSVKCQSERHCKIARALLLERKGIRENSPMTDRFIETAMARHV